MSRADVLGSVPHILASSPLMTISDIATSYGLTHRAIRFYEEQGLISSCRSSLGHRRYDGQALDRLDFVVEARAVGVPISALRALAHSGVIDDVTRRRGAILDACARSLDDLEHKLARVEAAIMRQSDEVWQPSGAKADGVICRSSARLER